MSTPKQGIVVMTAHLKSVPMTVELPRSWQKLGLFDRLILPFIHLGGGDRRAFERSAANVPLLASLGIVNLLVTMASATLLGTSIVEFFALRGRISLITWIGVAAYALTTLFVNLAIVHSQFQAHGAQQLMKMRPLKSPLPKIGTSNLGVVILRMVIAIVFAASLALPVKLNLTKMDQTVEIKNERIQNHARQANLAREAVDRRLQAASEELSSSRHKVSGLAFEMSAIEIARLGGDVPTPPTDIAGEISPTIVALARHVADFQHLRRQVTANRDAELALARKHDQDARRFRRRRNGARAAWLAERRAAAAQRRAHTLNSQLKAIETDLAKRSSQLEVYHKSIASRLSRAQKVESANELQFRELKSARAQDIVQRTRTSEGYRHFSYGIVGRIDALSRLAMKSKTARWVLAVIFILLVAWDLLPLLIKLAIKLPGYSLRIARENHEAYLIAAKAMAAADTELMNISREAGTELDAFRKDQRRQALDWYEGFKPLWLVRLKSGLGLCNVS